jgi:hypothetical protein
MCIEIGHNSHFHHCQSIELAIFKRCQRHSICRCAGSPEKSSLPPSTANNLQSVHCPPLETSIGLRLSACGRGRSTARHMTAAGLSRCTRKEGRCGCKKCSLLSWTAHVCKYKVTQECTDCDPQHSKQQHFPWSSAFLLFPHQSRSSISNRFDLSLLRTFFRSRPLNMGTWPLPVLC